MTLACRIVGMWLLLSGLALARTVTPEEEIQYSALDVERYFQRAGLVVDEPAIQEHLAALLRKLVDAAPDRRLQDCRAVLIRGVHANAFALPHCRLYVSTALYLALKNDAQLAAVMALELAHVQQHSVLLQRRVLDQRMGAVHVLRMVTAATVGFDVSYHTSGDPTQTRAVADLLWRVSIVGYTDEITQAAERRGLERLSAASYSAADAIRAFEVLRVAAPTTLPPRQSRPPLSANRDVLKARIERYRQWSASTSEAALASASAESAERAEALRSGLRLRQIRLLIDAGQIEAATVLLDEQIAAHEENGNTAFLAAELQRRREPTAGAMALSFYERAAQFPDAPAELFLNQGMLLRQSGESAKARRAFEQFLEREPESAEATLVKHLLSEPAPEE